MPNAERDRPTGAPAERGARHPRQHRAAGTVELDGTPQVVDAPLHPLSMVYGGGGVYGIAYGAGVAHGLASAGIEVASAPALGTSAGSWVAAALALGLAYDDMADLETPAVPNVRTGVLADIARQAFGEASHPLVAVSAVCVKSRRRHILDGGRYPSPTWPPPPRRSRACSRRTASTGASTSTGACGRRPRSTRPPLPST